MAKTQGFQPSSFIEGQTGRLRSITEDGKALAAVSGGVDSTLAAVLAVKALGDRVVPVLIDTGFMRLEEPERVREKLSRPPVEVKIRIVKASGRFMKAVRDESHAEEKRTKFREVFYQILREEAQKYGCSYLVQGTIAPDWIETQGGIKTQHNVLEQVGIDTATKYGFKLIEPLSELYKDQVRSLARHVGLPHEFAERQPFPGPGLLVRCIGKVSRPKLEALKVATRLVDEQLSSTGSNQYFAAVIENNWADDDDETSRNDLSTTASNALGIPEKGISVDVFEDRVTGVKGDERSYGRLVGVTLRAEARETYGWLNEKLSQLQSSLVGRFHEVTRVIFLVKEKKRGPAIERVPGLSIIARAVSTRDYMTAAVTPIPWKTLTTLAEAILKTVPNVRRVYYDITPKPPGTIEFE